MSTCWKCGKPVAEGTVECEYGCHIRSIPADEIAGMNREAAILESEASLARELENGDRAFDAGAQHLADMGAGSVRKTVTLPDGRQYLVYVKKL